MLQRIKTILDFKGLNVTRFADEVGVPRPIMSHILSGRNKPSLEVVQKILKGFPELSPAWLVMGEGAMLKTSENPAAPEAVPASKTEAATASEPEILSSPDLEKMQTMTNNQPVGRLPNVAARTTEKVIILYSDNTYREFEKQEE